LDPWGGPRTTPGNKTAAVVSRNQRVQSGNTDICFEYQAFKNQNKITTGTYRGRVLKASFTFKELYSFDSPLDYCDYGTVEITHNASLIDQSLLFEFFQNEGDQREHGIIVVNGEVFTTRQLFGGPFKRGDFPYFFYRDILFYKVSDSQYLMTARPAKWTIADQDYVMYHFYDLEKKTVIQFADLKSKIN